MAPAPAPAQAVGQGAGAGDAGGCWLSASEAVVYNAPAAAATHQGMSRPAAHEGKKGMGECGRSRKYTSLYTLQPHCWMLNAA